MLLIVAEAEGVTKEELADAQMLWVDGLDMILHTNVPPPLFTLHSLVVHAESVRNRLFQVLRACCCE